MLKILMPLAVALFLVTPARAQTQPLYQGNLYAPDTGYLGKIDNRGRIYAPDTTYTGRMDSQGRVYAPDTRYRGKIVPGNASGSFLPFELETRKTKP